MIQIEIIKNMLFTGKAQQQLFLKMSMIFVPLDHLVYLRFFHNQEKTMKTSWLQSPTFATT